MAIPTPRPKHRVLALGLLTVLLAPPAAGAELRAERGGEVTSSLQPEDFPTPPGAALTPSPFARDAGTRPAGAAAGTCTAPDLTHHFTIGYPPNLPGKIEVVEAAPEPVDGGANYRITWTALNGVRFAAKGIKIYLGGAAKDNARVVPTGRTRGSYEYFRADDAPNPIAMIELGACSPPKSKRCPLTLHHRATFGFITGETKIARLKVTRSSTRVVARWRPRPGYLICEVQVKRQGLPVWLGHAQSGEHTERLDLKADGDPENPFEAVHITGRRR